MTVNIGVIGTGEAGLAIGAGLHSAGARWVGGYDCRFADRSFTDRVRAAGIVPTGSLYELAEASDVLICLTSARSAQDVAVEIAPRLQHRHIYSDWNSTSPTVKRAIATRIVESGAWFADGAVMAAVLPHRHAVPVLLSGDGAADFCSAMAGLGMRLDVLGPEPGTASAVKMFRSLLVKGLEALLVECLAGAERFGVGERVLRSMTGTMPPDWAELAAYQVGRSVVHGQRRAEELRQVATTLRTAGLDPLLATAASRRLQWFVDQRPPVDLADGGLEPILRWLRPRATAPGGSDDACESARQVVPRGALDGR